MQLFRPPTNDLVLYHANCADGLAAAWAHAKACFRYAPSRAGADYQPVQYDGYTVEGGGAVLRTSDGAAHALAGRDVYLLDFSLKRPELEQVLRHARHVTLLDHHKTAVEALAGLHHPRLTARLDQSHSGAVLAWRHLLPGDAVPLLLAYVEDRDLWKWELPHSKAVSAVIAQHDSFELLDLLFLKLSCPGGVDQVAVPGYAVLADNDKRIERLLQGAHTVKVGTHVVKAVNTGQFVSEVAGRLAEGSSSFGACYVVMAGRTVRWSLRSRGDFDVSAVAKAYGGGGHKNAAGFSTSLMLLASMLYHQA